MDPFKLFQIEQKMPHFRFNTKSINEFNKTTIPTVPLFFRGVRKSSVGEKSSLWLCKITILFYIHAHYTHVFFMWLKIQLSACIHKKTLFLCHEPKKNNANL